jgi:hypothetical protein
MKVRNIYLQLHENLFCGINCEYIVWKMPVVEKNGDEGTVNAGTGAQIWHV